LVSAFTSDSDLSCRFNPSALLSLLDSFPLAMGAETTGIQIAAMPSAGEPFRKW
jgi:hypothetical protein